jgi:hypothetical protein
MRRLDQLDSEARELLGIELERHADVLRHLRTADRELLAAEVSRHLDRVDDILMQHSRRTTTTPFKSLA